MKTTVKLTTTIKATVSPTKSGGVLLELGGDEHPVTFHLTPDQCGALIFGMEQALEVAAVASVRETAQG